MQDRLTSHTAPYASAAAANTTENPPDTASMAASTELTTEAQPLAAHAQGAKPGHASSASRNPHGKGMPNSGWTNLIFSTGSWRIAFIPRRDF